MTICQINFINYLVLGLYERLVENKGLSKLFSIGGDEKVNNGGISLS
jgi:hypothetical protein